MNNPKIAIILGTTRATRFADKPSKWLLEIASRRSDLSFEILDLRDFPLPFFDEVSSNRFAPSKNATAQLWQKKLSEFDGFIFVTAEYNHSISAVLKNALDYAYPEWNRKPAAFLGYGSVGAARAIQHLKDICVELQMVPIRFAVHIQGNDFRAAAFSGKDIGELTYLEPMVTEMLDQMSWWATTLRNAREGVSSVV
jgi:NAD(P)H-dependent FMN reductase